MKKFLIINSIFIMFYYTSFGQKDSIINISIENPEIRKIRKNVISSELYFPLYDYIGYGINYERYIKNNNTFVLSLGRYYDNRSFSRFTPIKLFYCKLAYRFYFTKTRLSKTNQGDETYFLYKRQKDLLQPRGFYLGIIAAMQREHYNIYATYYSPDYSDRVLFDIGAGGSIGYQFIFINRLTLNLSLPVYMGYYTLYYEDDSGTKYENIKGFGIFPHVTFNLGFAF